jgi:hypothetical protein
VFSRNITLPVGFTTASGISSLSNTLLIAVDSSVSPQEVVQLTLPPVTIPPSAYSATMTTMFTLQADRVALGNFLYTSSGKLLIFNQDSISSTYYLTQYDYTTNAIDLDIDLGSVVPKSIFECECSVFVTDNNGDVYVVDSAPSYSLTFIDNFGIIPSSAAQANTCIICSLTDNANLITTTSTTTVALPSFCYTVQVNNTCDVSWIDYAGAPQTQTVTNDIIYICAQDGSITSACIPGSSVVISGGTISCISDVSCQPTTTTTTTVP